MTNIYKIEMHWHDGTGGTGIVFGQGEDERFAQSDALFKAVKIPYPDWASDGTLIDAIEDLDDAGYSWGWVKP